MVRLGILLWVLMAGAGLAQGLTGLARVQDGTVRDLRGGAELRLQLSQPVPYRVFALDAPRRLVLDVSVVDWAGFDAAAFDRAEAVESVRVGMFRPGWSRMVLTLSEPLAVAKAGMRTDGGAEITVELETVAAEEFSARAGAPESLGFELPQPAKAPAPRSRPDGLRPVMVVLDPGHGGIDPGAERDDAVEADLMLGFARELREVLERSGFQVTLTREDDVFVPLEMRLSIARAAKADVFLSLHADTVAEGRARGATIYTLSEEASDIASQKLAERHDRADLLAGVDLTEQDDQVAAVLMDLARQETAPRTDRLADALVAGLGDNIGSLHKRPRLEASFSVLKAPDIPSVLIELGFLSSERDRANLQSPEWRARAAKGIRDALMRWVREDAAEAELLRK